MNQQAARKAFPVLAREANKPTAPRQTKASLDSSEKPRHRSKSKNKIPRSVRYDLDNALVSLCDVWFEEIKPYLVRNNIKVHIHEADERREDAAAGDRDCSHLDPGAAPDHLRHRSVNCASYYSTQPIASKAPCRKPPPPLALLQELRPSPSIQIPCPNYSEALEPKTRKHRRHRRTTKTHKFPPQPNFVPRLCRTYSILPQTTLQNSAHKNQAQQGSGTKTNKAHMAEKSYIPGAKPKMKNKNIQTKDLTEIELKAAAQVKPCLKSYGRCYGTTSFFPEQVKRNNTKYALEDLSPLFKNDLIDIIAEKNEKRLQLLYKSPTKDYCPSAMNLLPSPTSKRKSSHPRKPWR